MVTAASDAARAALAALDEGRPRSTPAMAPPSDAARSAAATSDAAAAALAALDVNEAEHPCRGCGKPAPPAGEEPFQRCPLCVECYE